MQINDEMFGMITREEALTRLLEIYAIIPNMTCIHCHSCCGPILWFEPEEILIQEYLEKHQLPYIHWTKEEFEKHQMRCPYLYMDWCSIYPVRPIVCRLQGVIDNLTCEHNKIEHMTDNQVDKIKKMFFSLLSEMNSLDRFYGTRSLVNEVKQKNNNWFVK